MITQVLLKRLRYGILGSETDYCFIEQAPGMISSRFVNFERLRSFDQRESLSNTRVILEQNQKVLEHSNSSNFHSNLDDHMDDFVGLTAVFPAGSNRLAVELSQDTTTGKRTFTLILFKL
jgi:hypothetical protein